MNIVLESVVPFIQNRPYKGHFEEHCYIPHPEYQDFWDQIYTMIRAYGLRSPVRRNMLQYINPQHGFFGFRTHPVTGEENYFHTGISLALKHGRKIYPVLPGVLEYSGYGAVNGYYVLLSHPSVQTEDGYVLHSMYCHLKKPLVRFNTRQKILREVSLRSYPQIAIPADTVLGHVSNSGLVIKDQPKFYLQLSLRKFGKDPIMLDPLLCYQEERRQNIQ